MVEFTLVKEIMMEKKVLFFSLEIINLAIEQEKLRYFWLEEMLEKLHKPQEYLAY